MSNSHLIVMHLINSCWRLQEEGSIERLLRILWRGWWNNLMLWQKVSTNGFIYLLTYIIHFFYYIEESRVRAHFNAEYGFHLPEDICLCIGNAPTRWEILPWQDSSPEVLPFIPKDLIVDVCVKLLFFCHFSCELRTYRFFSQARNRVGYSPKPSGAESLWDTY